MSADIKVSERLQSEVSIWTFQLSKGNNFCLLIAGNKNGMALTNETDFNHMCTILCYDSLWFILNA